MTGFQQNPVALKQIKEQLDGHMDEVARQTIIEKVKSDPGLFVFCARNIKQHVENFEGGLNPIEALRTLEDEKLHKMFSVTDQRSPGIA